MGKALLGAVSGAMIVGGGAWMLWSILVLAGWLCNVGVLRELFSGSFAAVLWLIFLMGPVVKSGIVFLCGLLLRKVYLRLG